VELQSRAAELAAANTRIFAVSYDPVRELAHFAEQHGITYPLLSDEGSHVIQRLGLLNQHVAEQQAFAGRPMEPHHSGIPYPGLFLLDENGVIVDKQFEQTHQPRPAPDLILERIVGADALKRGVVATAEDEHSRAVAWLAASTYRPMQRLHLHVALQVGPELHVYGTPPPDGMVPLGVELEALEGLKVGAVDLPSARPMEVAGEQALVYTGEVAAVVPIKMEANLGEIQLKLRVHYQACTDSLCYPPASLQLELPLQGLDNLRPEPRA
jgi:peroxiredoxin